MNKNRTELSELGKIAPQDLALEEAVLGAVLLEKDAQDSITSFIIPDVFYNEANKKIYQAVLNLKKKKSKIDLLTATSELKAMKELENIGGPYYITRLTSKVSSSAHSEEHARILQQLYFRRELINISHNATKQGYDDYNDVFTTMEYIKKSLKALENNIGGSDKIVSNDEVIDTMLININSAKTTGGIIGASTGMKNLDHAIMGLRPGLKYVIAALPGEGKTSLAKSIAINLAHHQDIPGVFFSLEMTADQLMMSCTSELLKIDNEQLQKGELSNTELQRIADLKKTKFAKNFIIDATAGIDPQELRKKVVKYIQLYDIKWMVIDYLGLMKLKGLEHKNKNREQIVSEITAEIKNITKDFNLITIELSQFSREGSKRKNPRPIPSDLKDSSAIEANADVIIFPFRPEYHGYDNEEPGFTECIIAKNRFGRLQTVALIFNGKYTSFIDNEKGVELETSEEGPQYF